MTEEWKKRIQEYKVCWKDVPELLEMAERLLEVENKKKQQQEKIRDIVTVYVTAPLLCEYTAWVVREAALSGKKRLYFLARDGYYMKQAAEVFCSAWNLELECRYLYCSRYAWRGAVYYMNTEEALDYITLGGLEAGFQKMMQRAGLTTEETAEIAEQLGYDGTSQKRLSEAERNRLRYELAECKMFVELLQKHSKEKYDSTIAYLSQEGLLDNVPYALVDSGWTGSLQKSLAKLLKSTGCNKIPEGYYFGMYHRPKEKEAGLYHTYYFAPDSFIRRKVFFNNNVFECVYSAPHGMTTGYVKKDKWIPVLEQKDNPNRKRLVAAEPLLFACIKEYAVWYKGQDIQDTWEGTTANCGWTRKNNTKKGRTSKKRMERLLRLFMGRPTKEEAQEYGSFVFCDDVIGEEKQTLAGKLSREELKHGFLLAKLRNKVGRHFGKAGSIGRESAWPEGSVALVMGKKGFWHCALCEYVRLTAETLKNRKQGRKK